MRYDTARVLYVLVYVQYYKLWKTRAAMARRRGVVVPSYTYREKDVPTYVQYNRNCEQSRNQNNNKQNPPLSPPSTFSLWTRDALATVAIDKVGQNNTLRQNSLQIRASKQAVLYCVYGLYSILYWCMKFMLFLIV